MENNKNGSKLIPILVFAAVVLAVACYGFFFLNRTDNRLQGQADVTEVRISSKVPGRVARFLVDEGDRVAAGDTLAVLSIPDIEAKMAQASAAEAGAEAMNLKVLQGAREEQVQGAYEMWQQAVAGAEIAQKSYERVQRLYEKGVATAQKRDEAEANYKASAAREKAARSQYDLAVNGAQHEDRLAAQAQVQRARGAVAEANAYVSESYLISPVSGRVTERFVSQGELVGSGAPVMNISNEADKWGVFNVREDKLPGLGIGTTFKAYVPALGREMEMKVVKISDAGTYAVWKAAKTLGDYDRRTFQVKASFLSPSDEIIAGMSLLIEQ